VFPDTRERSLLGQIAKALGMENAPRSEIEQALIRALGSQNSEEVLRIADNLLPFVPVASGIKDVYEAATGYNVLTGERLSALQRGMAVFGAATLGAGSALIEGTEVLVDEGKALAQIRANFAGAERITEEVRSTQQQIRMALDSGASAVAGPTRMSAAGGIAGVVGADGRFSYAKLFSDSKLIESAFEPVRVHFNGTLTEDLVLVQFHSSTVPLGRGRTAAWWTTTEQANKLMTEMDVRQKLSLPLIWGPRDAVSIARIPKGTSSEFIKGLAKAPGGFAYTVYEGGGVQLHSRASTRVGSSKRVTLHEE
jgi:hypothetical protein